MAITIPKYIILGGSFLLDDTLKKKLFFVEKMFKLQMASGFKSVPRGPETSRSKCHHKILSEFRNKSRILWKL